MDLQMRLLPIPLINDGAAPARLSRNWLCSWSAARTNCAFCPSPNSCWPTQCNSRRDEAHHSLFFAAKFVKKTKLLVSNLDDFWRQNC